MGYPFGKAPQQTGTTPTPAEMPVYQGTTSADMQRIIGAQYMTSGVLPNGGLTVKGSSKMEYVVSPGACFMWINSADKLGMLVPVDGITVPTDPAPSTGSRVDVVYVDGNGNVRVNIGYQPGHSSGVIIAKFTVPAGITGTNNAQLSVDRDFAIPVGASMGRLHAFHDPASDGVIGNVSPMTLGQGRFFLPSDRIVRFDLTHCMGSTMEANQTASIIRWRIYVDNAQLGSFVTRAEWDWPQTQFTSISTVLSEGAHTVHYTQDLQGGARFVHRKGTAAGYLGNRFEVWDAGVSR